MLELERFGTRTGFWNGLSSDSKVSLYFGFPSRYAAYTVMMDGTVLFTPGALHAEQNFPQRP